MSGKIFTVKYHSTFSDHSSSFGEIRLKYDMDQRVPKIYETVVKYGEFKKTRVERGRRLGWTWVGGWNVNVVKKVKGVHIPKDGVRSSEEGWSRPY